GSLSGTGIRLSMDDFGTGYSSLSYLSRLPVHEIKIDKSFALAITGGEDDNAAIVRATIEMAHSLRKEVVAEGVETEAVWDLLKSLGCDSAQGFYMGRPMPQDDLTRWLRASRWGRSMPPALPGGNAKRPDPARETAAPHAEGPNGRELP
ncbi:MAG TPA: EAL domain-containing protein, partial [Armatimonadota bacterium]